MSEIFTDLYLWSLGTNCNIAGESDGHWYMESEKRKYHISIVSPRTIIFQPHVKLTHYFTHQLETYLLFVNMDTASKR